MLPRSWLERRRIQRAAKAKLGLQAKQSDKYIFMRQCVQEMMIDGTAADAIEAEMICEMLWEEESDLFDDY